MKVQRFRRYLTVIAGNACNITHLRSDQRLHSPFTQQRLRLHLGDGEPDSPHANDMVRLAIRCLLLVWLVQRK